jgi:hypothetical protein
MKKTLLVIFLSLLSASASFSQIKLNVKASVNNTFRYGNGYEYAGLNRFEKEYFENLTDARLNVNDVIFGLRYEISDPIEYGLDFKGIRKRFVEYNNSDLGVNLRAGDFWEIFSRGLTLNVFEDRTLAYDTGIDGIRLGYEKTFNKKNPVRFRAQVLGGDLNYSDFLNPSRIENYQVRNANFDISPVKQFTIGGSYVYSKGRIPSSSDTTAITAELPEVNLNLNLADFQFYTSYARKHINSEPGTLFPDPISADGDGLYSSASFSKGGLGVTLEYKNYRFDLTAPDNRSADRPTKMLPFQNPPTAQREHTSTLISRNPHVVDFNDEVGGQVDVIYAVNDKLTFNLNGSIASKHYEYQDIDTSSRIVYQRVDRSDDYIPNLDDKFSPFWEVYLESEYYATDRIYTKLAFARQSETIFNNVNPLSSEKIMVTTIPAEFRYEFNSEYALKLVLEQQWLNNSIRIHQKSYMNQLVQVNLTKSPQLSFTLNAEFTNDEEEPTGKQSWFLGEVLYKLNQTNTLTVSYGSERGGLRCTNGICRFVNPFEGFRMTIQSQF